MKKRITQEEADEMATKNEEFLHCRRFEAGEEFHEIGKRADFSNCDLSGITFSECFLDEVSFKNANLENCVFKWCSMHHAHIYNADLQEALFFECELDGANLMNTNCINAKFVSCDIRDGYFTDADLSGVELSGTDLSESILRNVKIDHTDNPIKCKGVTYDKVLENEYVKQWLKRQAYIAELMTYHPIMTTLWRWISDYNRSLGRVIFIYCFIIGLFGAIYNLLNVVEYESVSIFTPYYLSFLNMNPTIVPELLAFSVWGEGVIMIQKVVGFILMCFILFTLIEKFFSR